MTVLFIVIMFAVILLIDHLTNRNGILVDQPAAVHMKRRLTLVPAFVRGFQLRDNLRYHPGHTWALGESPELVRVGMDDFAARLAGRFDKLELPTRGQWIRQGQKIVGIHRNGQNAELVSPVEGIVSDVNERVLVDPELARRDPFGDGWLLKVNAPDAAINFRNLLSGSLARQWLDDAATKLSALLPQPAGAVAQDGGLVVDDLGSLL